MSDKCILLFILFFLVIIEQASGHGRLSDPASRSTAWRHGFKTVPNYDDHQLYCGGKDVQWKQNNGKCGVCGDAFNGARDNEVPNGKYAKKLAIVRTYKSGQTFSATVQLTANHAGYFIFKVCPAKSRKREVTQQCLDRHRLQVLNSKSKSKYKFRVKNTGPGMFTAKLRLPNGLKCKRCVFQWTYTAGNNWGKCRNGKSKVGCGPQETFRACADIRIN